MLYAEGSSRPKVFIIYKEVLFFFVYIFVGQKNFKMYTALSKNYLSHILLYLQLTSFLNTI